MGLALDEPKRHDLTLEIEGQTFLVDQRLPANLESYLPFTVEYDERFAFPFRVSAGGGSGCC